MLWTVERRICSCSYIIHYLLHSDVPDTIVRSARFVWPSVLVVLLAGGLAMNAQNPRDGTKPPDETPPDKFIYDLLHPTPSDLMRELSTDRPDQTESPYTVDAGHFQVEIDLVSAVFDRDRSGGGDRRTTGWGTEVNLKAGLWNNVDIQFVFDPFVHARLDDLITHTKETASGFADFQTRLKVNLWGNDGGKTALAIMPFVKWPLPVSGLRNGQTEGGVIFPLAIELPAGWSTTLMTEYDFVSTGVDGYSTDFVNSITFSHDLVGELGGYIEFFSVVSSASNSKWEGQFDLGFTYGVNDNLQLDTGCNFGVAGSAPDFNPFVGFSFRF
jgi:Putative MetA-pathway of phenol degradation